MKKLFFILLLIIPFFGISQTKKPIEGFLGIKLGSDKVSAMATLKAKGAVFNKKDSEKDILIFSNVKLGLRDASDFAIKTVNEKVYAAHYIFTPEAEGKLIDYYNDLVSDLTKIYGEGEVVEEYNQPYTKNDGLSTRLTGMSAGKITFSTTWKDKNTKNTIQVYIETNMNVRLIYQNDTLSDIADAKQKAKEKSDF